MDPLHGLIIMAIKNRNFKKEVKKNKNEWKEREKEKEKANR